VPETQLRIVRNGNNVVRILGSDDFKRVDGVSMAIFREGALLYRCVLLLDVPLYDVTRLGGANYNVGLERIEDGFCYFIVAVESVLWPCLEVRRKDVYHAIRLIVSVFEALAIAHHQ
jgi:hypothetical protein